MYQLLLLPENTTINLPDYIKISRQVKRGEIHRDLSAFFLHLLCLLFRRAHRHPLAVPGVARRGHLLVGAEDGLPRLGQVHVPVAAGGLDHVPQVGNPVPLAVHHRAGEDGLGPLAQQGQGQGHPLAVGRPLQQRVVGGGAAPLLIGAGLAHQPDQLGERILPPLDARLGQQAVRLPLKGVAPALQGLAGLVVGEQHSGYMVIWASGKSRAEAGLDR